MASYGVLTAIQNYWYDGPEGVMGFAPRLTPNQFKGFFTAAEGWGNISQIRKGGSQQNTVEVKHGRLILRQLRLSLADGLAPKSVNVFCNDQQIPSSYEVNDKTEVSFSKIELKKGDKLRVQITL
jgi:hypothetical protein